MELTQQISTWRISKPRQSWNVAETERERFNIKSGKLIKCWNRVSTPVFFFSPSLSLELPENHIEHGCSFISDSWNLSSCTRKCKLVYDSSWGTEGNTFTNTLALLKAHFSRVVLKSRAWRKHLGPCCQTQTGGHWSNEKSSAKEDPPCKTPETSGLCVVNG